MAVSFSLPVFGVGGSVSPFWPTRGGKTDDELLEKVLQVGRTDRREDANTLLLLKICKQAAIF